MQNTNVMESQHPDRVFFRNEISQQLEIAPVMVYEMFSVLELERAHLNPISARDFLTLVVTVESGIVGTRFHEIPLKGLLENYAFPDCVFFYKGNAKMQLPLGEGIKKVSFSIHDSSLTMFNMKLICQFRYFFSPDCGMRRANRRFGVRCIRGMRRAGSEVCMFSNLTTILCSQT